VIGARLARSKAASGTGEWFLSSGIQGSDGGFARYYLSGPDRYAPFSTEITAYCASALIAFYRESADTRYRDAALRAAGYLVKAWDTQCCAMPFECGSENGRYSYFFDNGIIVRGLLAVWRESQVPEILSTAINCAVSMAHDFIDGEHYAPVLQLPCKSPLDFQPARWSWTPGCYQLKAALAWYEIWQLTKERRYLELYRHLLDLSVANHSAFLPGCDAVLPVMDRLHAYAYFLEGLLPVIEERRNADVIAEGISRVATFVNRVSPLFIRSDVIAQLLRVRLLAHQHGILPLDGKAAQQEVLILKSFRCDDSDPRLNGGFWFGRRNGTLLPFMNPVSTVFCYQAQAMWKERGQKALRWQSLI